MRRNGREILLYAIAISVVIHLLVLPLVHLPRTGDDIEPPHRIAFETARPMPTPKPTLRPTPPPTPRPHAVTPPHAHVRRPVVKPPPQTVHGPAHNPDPFIAGAARPGNGPDVTGDASPGPDSSGPPATGAPLPTPSPIPTATKPACANPNVPASTAHIAEPETPPMAQRQGISGEVSVLVSLDDHSRLTDARVFKSPSSILNPAALRSARDTTYRTEIRDCKPIAADYLFVVEFTAQ
jgi:outer membrane biosynthesis protein TonB